MSKHTPGPWSVTEYENELLVTSEKSGAYVALCDGISATIDSSEELQANARLIAAAPDLLHALKSFLRAPSAGSNGPGSVTIVVQSFNFDAARAAIAKTEGTKEPTT